ncbi:sterol O-acyltransferase 1, partial [Biomphalaria glabrata]
FTLLLHAWLNAFAEMMRFGDRLFYNDWWNASSYSHYFKTWNIVVQDWIYFYLYRDFLRLTKCKAGARLIVFFISAFFHEYAISVAVKCIYPCCFICFAGISYGFTFIHVKEHSRLWNLFVLSSLFVGNGILMGLYSIEFYARQNCPPTIGGLADLVIPRSWFCKS